MAGTAEVTASGGQCTDVTGTSPPVRAAVARGEASVTLGARLWEPGDF